MIPSDMNQDLSRRLQQARRDAANQGLDAILGADIDANTFTVDDPAYLGGQLRLVAVNGSHELCTFAGDPLARATLINRIYKPLQAHSTDLLATLWSYLDNGRSLEATARELFVHPNTVRYRLKRVSDVIGWDATGPREALILQTALIIGSIGTEVTRRRAVRRPG